MAIEKNDLLRMDYINSLPQPFLVNMYTKDGEWEWPVIDIEVSCGLFRIDVCGMCEVHDIGDAKCFIDAHGVRHDVDTFFSDYEDYALEVGGG